MTRYDVVCVHTIVGNPPAHAAHFSTRADGHIFQSRDTAYRSAANYRGNHRVIAIENDDHGPEYGVWNTRDGHAVPRFTVAQVEAVAQICAWAHRTHGVPLVLCPNSLPTSRGIAYHRQGIDGNWTGYAYGGRVTGGELWSESGGKVCPGDRRIRQLIEEIIPRAREIAGLEQDLDANDKNTLNALAWRQKALNDGALTVDEDAVPANVRGEVVQLNHLLSGLAWRLKALVDAEDAVSSHALPENVRGETLEVVRLIRETRDELNKLHVKVDTLTTRLETPEVPGVDVTELATRLAALVAPTVANAVNDEFARRQVD
jgi:hypothetical protein